MSQVLDIVRAAKAAGDFAALVRAIPYAQFLGISVQHQDGAIVGRLAYADALIGNANIPALHGGAIGALLESTAIFQTLWEVETQALPKIVTITIDYLRSGRPVDTFARGTITKHGKRVVTVGVEAWQDTPDKPIARANTHFLIKPLDV